MPEVPVNAPLSPREAIATVNRAIQDYLDRGTCIDCAIALASDDTQVAHEKVWAIWFDGDED